MGIFKQLMALVLAVALTVTTMSVAFAQGGVSAVGTGGTILGFTSGITVAGKDTVKPGETTQYTAQVINTGVVGYSQEWSWSVDNKQSANTVIDNTGKLTVGADETSNMLTIAAYDGVIFGMKNVTVEKNEGSIVVEGPETVNNGSTAKYTATLSDALKDKTVVWSVTGNSSDLAKIDSATGELTVEPKAYNTKLTIVATIGSLAGTKEVTVTHVHIADCLLLFVDYDWGLFPGIDCAHMDLSESTPHTNYVSTKFLMHGNDDKLGESTIKLSVEGELKDKLVITSPTVDGNSDHVTFIWRFTLTKGAKLDPGVYSVPVNMVLTMDGKDYSFKEDIPLLAVSGNPLAIDNEEDTGATFVVDLLDVQPSYTSTPAAITLPKGMEIESVTVENEYNQDEYYDVNVTEDGLTVTTKLSYNMVRIGYNRLPLQVKLKGFETPISASLEFRTVLENRDFVSLSYKTTASLPTDEQLDFVPVIANEYKDIVTVNNLILLRTKNVDMAGINSEYLGGNNHRFYAWLYNAGKGTFDVQAKVSATIPLADGVSKLHIGEAKIDIPGNPLEVTGSMDDAGLVNFKLWRHIDLNDTDTFKQVIKLEPTNGIKVEKVSFNSEQDEFSFYDKIEDLFTVDYGTTASDGSREVTVTLKNNESTIIDVPTVRYAIQVTLEGEGAPLEPIQREMFFSFKAKAPEATMYAYDTDKVVKEDLIAVKESRKYDIRVNNYTGIKQVWLYNGDKDTDIIRGVRFLSDRNPTETITVVGNRTSEDSYIDIDIIYKPIITNEAVKITLSNNLLMTSKHKLADIYVGSRPDNDDDDDDDDDDGDDDDGDDDDDDDDIDDPEKPEKPEKPDNGNSGNNNDDSKNNANTPAVSEKISSAVAAVKKLDKLTSDKLPAGVQVSQTANGTSIATVPVALTSGNATLGMGLVNALGHASSNVGLDLTIAHSIQDKIKIILPGGFGKITEPGRIGFSMDYNPVAPAASTMLAQVKGEKVVNSTAQIGGNFTLPVAATVTVKSKAPEGSTVNIYKYDTITRKMIFVASAKVANGNLTFDTKTFGQMIFTTGKIQ